MRHDDTEASLVRAALGLVTTVLVLLATGYALAACVAWTAAGVLPPLGPTVQGIARLPWHLDDPAAAFPGGAAWIPQNDGGVWSVGVAAVGLLMAVAAVGIEVDRLRGRRRIASRAYDPRRVLTPRAWARPRDLEELRDERPDSWSTLRLDGRWIRTAPETHVLLVAPTGSGKTTGPVTTWILEHRGPVLVTSPKRDILDITAGARLGEGPVWVFAPGVDADALPLTPCGWTPLSGCQVWEHAQLMGGWIAGTTNNDGVTESDAAKFYNREAGRLLSALLHAAALDGRDMRKVNAWLRSESMWIEPLGILRAAGAMHASEQLDAYRHMDSRPRSLVITSAGQLIDAYELESIARSDRHDFDPDEFLRSGGTLYLIAPEALQHKVRPIFAGLLSSVMRAAELRAMHDGPLDPPLRCILDETARLAAIEDLPGLTSISRGWGVRIATVWQGLGQIKARYGRAGDELMGNSLAKLVLGPIQDRDTREELVALLDIEHAPDLTYELDETGGRTARSVRQREQNKVTAQVLQQLRPGEALLLHGHSLPAVGRITRWWERGKTRRQVNVGRRRLAEREPSDAPRASPGSPGRAAKPLAPTHEPPTHLPQDPDRARPWGPGAADYIAAPTRRTGGPRV